MSIHRPKALAVVGPTASGKTSLSIALAQPDFLAPLGYPTGGEIISADSRQIYRGMDIGTAKAPRDQNSFASASNSHVYNSNGIPHHLIDIRNPNEDYTVADFKRDAIRAIDNSVSRNRFPILVGGTGLYVRAVVDNIEIPTIAGDPRLRAEIEADITAHGLASVFDRLVALDPEAAYVVDPRNPRRVIRALEVALLTGRPFTEQRLRSAPLYDFLMIGLSPSPEILRERIDKRIDEMMEDGLVDEVRKLVQKYRRTDGTTPVAFDAIGYREVIDYLDGAVSLTEAVAAMKTDTWQFARRQMTWFRKEKNVRWVENTGEAKSMVTAFLTHGTDIKN